MRAILVAAAMAFGAVGAAQAAGAMFVMIQQSDHAACSKTGEVTGTVAVRAGAGNDYEKVDTLSAGAKVSVCDGANGWYGIVYSHGNLDCETTQKMPKGPYAGPCRTGWVPTSSVAG